MPLQISEERRFRLWEYLGALIAFGAIVIPYISIKAAISYKAENLKQFREEVEARRPVDAVNAVLMDLKPVKVVDYITLPGQIQAWEKSQVSSQVSGKVIKKLEEGAQVKEGDPILYIDDKDYRINLADKEAAYDKANQNYLRIKKLKTSRISSLSELEVAEADFNQAKSEYDAAKLSLQRCVIRAPFAGIVDVVTPEIGELVDVGLPVATVAQLGELKVEVGIPEKDVDFVRDLKSCEVVVESAKVKREGTKTYLSYLTAPGTQVYTLRLKMNNKDGKLRPGMFCKVRVVREIRKNFMIPIYSVLAKDDKHYVFVAGSYEAPKGKGKDPRQLFIAVRKNVKIGVVQGAEVEILEGLEPGEKLVVVGQRNMDAGTTMSIQSNIGSMSELKQ